MDFRILGPLEVTDDIGRAVTPPGRTGRALLALLLLDANRFCPADRLIDELWPDEPPENAAKALQIHVSRLRKALGENRLETLPGGYRLRVEPGELDWERARERVERAELLLGAGNAEAARAAFAAAESLFRGRPLGDLAPHVARRFEDPLDDLSCRAAEGRLESRLALGATTEAIPELRQEVARHPERERLRALLMLALYRCGRQAEALAVYRDAATYLDEELGLVPGPDLRELERRILRHDPALYAAGNAPVEPPEERPGRRRRLLWAAAGAAAAIAVAAGVVVAGTRGGATVASVPPRSLAVLAGDDLRLVRAVRLPAAPGDVAVGPRAAFVALPGTRSVGVVMHRGGGVSTVGAPVRPSRLVTGASAVWVVDALGRRVARLGSSESTRIPSFSALDAAAAGDGSLWLAERNATSVYRFDPASALATSVDNDGADNFFEGHARRAAALAHGSVWVSNPVTIYPATDRLGRVSRIDLATAQVTARIRLPAPPVAIAATARDVWVAVERGESVWRIDPGDDVAAGAVRVPGGAIDLASDGESVWALGPGGRVSRLDPDRGEVAASALLSRAGRALAAHEGTVYVAVE